MITIMESACSGVDTLGAREGFPSATPPSVELAIAKPSRATESLSGFFMEISSSLTSELRLIAN
jgi:hypothetical protein